MKQEKDHLLSEKIVDWLFLTKAIEVANPEQPFWYTSGKIGPYYINTHYLYGSKEDASSLLEVIEEAAATPLTMPARLTTAIMRQYKTNEIFSGLVDLLVARLKGVDFDFVSGGERRDYFFSLPVALLLEKPHLSILKDGRSVYSEGDFKASKWSEQAKLKKLKALHIADLVTEASSYIRTWLPVLASLDASIEKTLAVVDRCQGGADALAAKGVSLLAMIQIDKQLFSQALAAGYLSQDQQAMITDFTADPNKYMQAFFQSHPNFLKEQLQLGGKPAQRAELCMKMGYHLST